MKGGRSVIVANVIIIIIITFDNTRRCAPLALSVADLSAPLLSRVGSTERRLQALNYNNFRQLDNYTRFCR